MQAKENKWPKETPRNIIVRMPNWLGDLVMGTPVLAELRARYPEAKITAMCQANVAPLLKADPNINELLSFKRPSGWIHRSQHMEIIENLQRGQFDLGVLLTNSISSAWWFWKGKVKNRLGYSNGIRNLLLNKVVPWPKNVENQHLVITYQMLLEPLGIPVSDRAPKLFLDKEEVHIARDLLAKVGIAPHHTLIGINPGAAYGSAKCWLPERYQAVTQRLLEDPETRVIYFGDQAGAALVNDICKDLPEERVVNLAGKTTLRSLMALISCCSAILTNDSGPMHIAAALNVPLLALFGSTSDVKTGPYANGKVIHKHVECSPCYKRVCPIDFRCMTRISVEEVYQEIRRIMGK